MVDISRVIEKLDGYFEKNDMAGAEKHLLYWFSDAKSSGDGRCEVSLLNELMGLYRKMRREEEAVGYAEAAVVKSQELHLENTVSYGTTLLNAATVYKAFGYPEKAMPFYEKALENYNENLDEDDVRLAGLYNNMGLALCDLKRFDEAVKSYEKAIKINGKTGKNRLEEAISYLNLANVIEAKEGLAEGEETIGKCLDEAERLLLNPENERNGYYAFVAEKCAPTFGYYGRFYTENILSEESKKIYENNKVK